MAKWGGKSSGDNKKGGAGYRADPEIDAGSGPLTCPTCKGTGFVSREHRNVDSEDATHNTDFNEKKCDTCKGKGTVG